MPIYSGSDKIKEIYNGSQSIGYVYNGSQLVWQHNPYPIGTVIANTRTAGSFVIYPGTYELKIAGAGGTGSGTNGYWVGYTASGGSGAAWEGTFKFSGSPTTFSWTTGTGAGASVAVSINGTRQLNAGGGGNGTTTTTTQAGGAGGVITVDSAFSSKIISTSLSSNGNDGDGKTNAWQQAQTAVTAAVSTLGWGVGANSKNEGRTEGGLYIKRIA